MKSTLIVGLFFFVVLLTNTFAANVFVSPQGIDSPTCGNATTHSCKTISYALSLNITVPNSFIYVMSGVYDIASTVVINTMNITIAGRFSSTTTQLPSIIHCWGNSSAVCFMINAPGVHLRGLTFAGCDSTGMNCEATIVSANALPAPPIAIINCTFTGLQGTPVTTNDGILPALIRVSNLGVPPPAFSTDPPVIAGVPTLAVPGLNLTDVRFNDCQRQAFVSALSANVDATRVSILRATGAGSFNYPSSLFQIQNTFNSTLYTTVRFDRLSVISSNTIGNVVNVTTFSPVSSDQFSGVFNNCTLITNTAQQLFHLYGSSEGNFLFQYGRIVDFTGFQGINAIQGQHIHIRSMTLATAQRLLGSSIAAMVVVQGTQHAGDIDDLEITNSILEANNVPAVYLSTFASATITNSQFNSQYEQSMSLWVLPGYIDAQLRINNVTFNNNLETPIVIDSRFETDDSHWLTVTVANSKFTNNHGAYAGAIVTGSHHATIVISGTQFINNAVVQSLDNFRGTISCTDHSTPNIQLISPLNIFDQNEPRNFGSNTAECVVVCDTIHEQYCTEVAEHQDEQQNDHGVAVAHDPSWIILGVLVLAGTVLILLALLFVGVFAQNFKQEYETL